MLCLYYCFEFMRKSKHKAVFHIIIDARGIKSYKMKVGN